MIIIDSGYFYVGVVLNNKDIVVRAPPIVKYMAGWHKDKVLGYGHKKKWKINMDYVSKVF